jgi:hypothetical protein
MQKVSDLMHAQEVEDALKMTDSDEFEIIFDEFRCT